MWDTPHKERKTYLYTKSNEYKIKIKTKNKTCCITLIQSNIVQRRSFDLFFNKTVKENLGQTVIINNEERDTVNNNLADIAI